MDKGDKVRIIKKSNHSFDIGEVIEFTGEYTDPSGTDSFMPIFYSESRSITEPIHYLYFEPADMKGKKFRVWNNDGTHYFKINDIVYHTGEYAEDFSSAKYKRDGDGFEQFVVREDLNFIMQFTEEDKDFIRRKIGRPKKIQGE